jgi:aminoglycoside phosphotransferase (APT) family kinase protein
MMANGAPSLRVVEELCGRIFGRSRGLRVARVAEGVSTYVFRVERVGEVFYLRVLPEEGASFAPEALAHRLLRERGAHVPKIVYWERRDPTLQRSVMVTTEIKGCALGHGSDAGALRAALVAAGREIALANAIPVRGFGWIRRDAAAGAGLQGEVASLEEWLLTDLDERLALLLRGRVFPAPTIEQVRVIVADSPDFFDGEQAYLAHGDFDATHIYHDNGVYTGIIDWGEIRGTQPLYDLGHFSIENGPMLPFVLEGYRQVADLPVDYERRILMGSLFVATGRLARGLLKRPERPAFAPDVAAVERAVAALGS